MPAAALPIFHRFENLDAYRASELWATQAQRHQAERALALACPTGVLDGMCTCCGGASRFAFSAVPHENGAVPNWREELHCSGCGLIMRWRYCFTVLDQLLQGERGGDIYITDNASPTYAWLHARYPNATGSEYVRDEESRLRLAGYLAHLTGEPESTIRHEDVTALSFDTASLDAVLSMEVLEHVPDYPAALREFHRVLRPGGALLLTVPFLIQEHATEVRARLHASGEIEHLLEPEFHGDPTSDEGCLAFYNFGWELLDVLRELGFRDVALVHAWAPGLGFMGFAGALVATR